MTPEPSAYRDSFFIEAQGHLEQMNAELLAAERSPRPIAHFNEMFRATHTVKGMAAMMHYDRIAGFCHAMEDALDRLRKGEVSLHTCVDLLFRCLDALAEAIHAVENDEQEPDLSVLTEALREPADAGAAAAPGAPAKPPSVQAKASSVPVKVERLDLLMNLAEEMVVAKMRFDQLRESVRTPDFSAAVDALDRLVAELQYQVTEARLVPIGLIFGRFPRLVRDLARRQNKEVALAQEGGEIELDRMISEEIGESLIHLLRNAVDHGIEPPEERRRKAKPLQGRVRIAASRTGDAVLIEVEDDGAGLDLEAIGRAAIDRGLLRPNPSPDDVIEALFRGVSTTPEATTVSGRGLGLDIAMRKVERLGGKLSVSSRPGRSTKFQMELPLTLAIFKALFVSDGGSTYAIPMANVDRIVAIDSSGVRSAFGREAAVVGSQGIPILRLRPLLGLPDRKAQRNLLVIVRRGDRRIGLIVDAALDTQEIVVKPLNRLLRENRYFAGSAIIGTGKAVLVLDAEALLALSGAEAAA